VRDIGCLFVHADDDDDEMVVASLEIHPMT
jgi:hypothetical protein